MVGSNEQAVPAELALDALRSTKNRRKGVRLVAYGLLFALGSYALTPALYMAAVMLLVPVALVLMGTSGGDRYRALVAQLKRAKQLPLPHAASVAERRLRVGTAGAPIDTWLSIPLTKRQERDLRQLAVPAARVVRGGDGQLALPPPQPAPDDALARISGPVVGDVGEE